MFVLAMSTMDRSCLVVVRAENLGCLLCSAANAKWDGKLEQAYREYFVSLHCLLEDNTFFDSALGWPGFCHAESNGELRPCQIA